MSNASARPWEPPSLADDEERAGAGTSPEAETAPGAAGPAGSEPAPDTRPVDPRVEEEARRAGYDAGYAEGVEAGQAALAEAAGRLRAVLENAAAPQAELDAETEQALVALALEVSRRVVLHELSLGPEPLLAAMRECLKRVPVPRGPLRLRLNPADRDLIASAGDEVVPEGMELEADPGLSPGGCVLEVTESPPVRPERRWRDREEDAAAQVDARVERRWRQVLAVLFDEDLIQ